MPISIGKYPVLGVILISMKRGRKINLDVSIIMRSKNDIKYIEQHFLVVVYGD